MNEVFAKIKLFFIGVVSGVLAVGSVLLARILLNRRRVNSTRDTSESLNSSLGEIGERTQSIADRCNRIAECNGTIEAIGKEYERIFAKIRERKNNNIDN